MNKSKVSIVRAHDYDYAEIHAAMEKSIELIGGLAKIVPPGDLPPKKESSYNVSLEG